MSLVILVPLEARVHPVEVPRLPRPVLIRPQIDLIIERGLHRKLRLVVRHSLASLTLQENFLLGHHGFDLLAAAGDVHSGELQPLVVVFFGDDDGAGFYVLGGEELGAVAAGFVRVEEFVENISGVVFGAPETILVEKIDITSLF